MLHVLDASAVRNWCVTGLEGLRAARGEIDDLNVYPVPDGDTGTNLLLTMEAVVVAVREAGPGLAETARAMASGALLGARGNSGVILSQLLRGVAEVLSGPGEPGRTGGPGAADLQRALGRAADLAYEAVAVPAEGTLLTVARAAADAAAALVGADLAQVTVAARSGASRALALTTEQLPQLRAAGVVDAGGRGLCVLLEALESVVTGRGADAEPAVPAPGPGALAAAREAGSPEFAYEVQYLLTGTDAQRVDELRRSLGDLGDSLVVVGDGEQGPTGRFNVHVHVNDVGAALEAGVAAGEPSHVTVTRFEDQMDERPTPVMNERPAVRAVVAVAPGEGLAGLFRAAGATVVDGGPLAGPSLGDLLGAARDTGAREVVLLPNDPDVHPVAHAAARQADTEGLVLRVVATRSCLQGLAAVAVDSPGIALDDAVAAMTAAADEVRWASVTVAVRAAETAAGPCVAGDALGLVGGEVVLVGADLEQAACGVLDALLRQETELVTVATGTGAPDGIGDRLRAHVGTRSPAVEVSVYEGGQPHYPLLLSAE